MKDSSLAIHPDHVTSLDTHYTGTLMGRITAVKEYERTVLLLGERFNLGVQAGLEGVVRIKTFRGTKPNWKTTPAIVHQLTAEHEGINWSLTDEKVELRAGQLNRRGIIAASGSIWRCRCR